MTDLCVDIWCFFKFKLNSVKKCWIEFIVYCIAFELYEILIKFSIGFMILTNFDQF